MIFIPVGRSTARRPSLILCLLFVIVMVAQLSAAQNTNDDDVTTSNDSTDSTDSNSDTTDTNTTTSNDTTDNNYPVVTPPPLDDAPYMKKSNTPEGTVFIAVGAVLGAMGLSVLAWRGLVAWSVNRSVRQAAVKHSSESKGLLRSKRKRSRSHGHGHGQHAVSLEKLSSNRRSAYRDNRASKIPTSGSGLFFSPTAGMNNSGNRASSYLPAGYYAAGSAASQSGNFSDHHIPGLGPQARGYTRTGSGPTPPQSPMLSPTGPHGPHEPQYSNLRQSYAANSTSSLNLASPPQQGRTPSAYLEDLFENHAPQNGRH